MNILGLFQRLGKVLQFSTIVLPVAALLLRLGQPDSLNVSFITQAGGITFDNLALILAIGVASSWSKDSAGVAVLTGAVGYFVLTKTMVIINPAISMGVLIGIIAGLVGDAVYNRQSGIKPPDFLSFLSGKRFMPIATDSFCLVLAAIFGYVQPPVQNAVYTGGRWIMGTGALGSSILGFINRPLILTDLHQVLNTIAWFQIGEFTSATSTIFHGGINRFYAGGDTAGMFMSDFSPIMMLGLSGATLTMYFAAPKERRPMVGGMLLLVAITTSLIDVTKSLEFLLTFLAPLLYLLHTLLTGISLFAVTLLGIHTDFSFSAGAIDYVLMYNLPAASQNVWMLMVMGLAFFVIYFVLFSAVTRMFNLKASGREDKGDDIVTEEANDSTEEDLAQLATNYVTAVGGADNLKTIDACITRLHLTAADSGHINDVMCKRLGASGIVKLNKQTIQVIIGAKAESIGDEMKKVVACGPAAAASGESALAATAPVTKPQAVANAATAGVLIPPIAGDVVALGQVPDETLASKAVGDDAAAELTDKIMAAPATGTIAKIFSINHVFCLGTVKGTEVIVHTGIDTVALEGKDFKRLVEKGAEVTAGQPIPEMGLKFLNANVRPMIGLVVRNNSDDFGALVIEAEGHVVAGQTLPYETRGK